MSDPAWEMDIYDDEFWKGHAGIMQRRQSGFAAMDRLDALSRRLIQQADAEFEHQQAAVSPEERERRENRERTLMELVVRANAETDAAEAEKLWAAVDAIVFGPGTER